MITHQSFFTILSTLFCVFLLGISLQSCAQKNKQGKEDKKTMNDFKINKTDTEWKQSLSDNQYYILREKGTERPFSGEFLMHQEAGNYTCAACGNVLFKSDSKFDSHCGWPSFDNQTDSKAVVTKEDNTHGMKRVEIMCGKCGGHLGHIFNDGPTDTGLRYCVNSVSLGFEPLQKNTTIQTAMQDNVITLGGGCFWCTEAVFQEIKGVKSVVSGYAGGEMKKVDYKMVCTGETGHAEVIQITYDPSLVSLPDILKVFFTVHDPTTLNRQGGDVGTQYRSAIFYTSEEQKKTAEEVINALTKEHVFSKPIVTEVSPLKNFIKAEDYHQDYYANNPEQAYCNAVIPPKLEKLNKAFKHLVK